MNNMFNSLKFNNIFKEVVSHLSSWPDFVKSLIIHQRLFLFMTCAALVARPDASGRSQVRILSARLN
jgi:hypothetical protein